MAWYNILFFGFSITVVILFMVILFINDGGYKQ